MNYPKKPRYFKSAYQIEVDRRLAITAAYQTLYKEVYEENKKLKKTLAQLQRNNYMDQSTIQILELENERNKEAITNLEDNLRGLSK